MSMLPYSDEELNYFKFASIVLKEFPDALRRIFVDMWDTKVAASSTVWDDSAFVRNILHNNEAPDTKIPTNNSFKEWDCTALFQATLYARTFALPDSTGKKKTLGEMYLKGRKPAPSPFHSAVTSSSGDANETIALAIDQLRLLRNTLCHTSSPQINKVTFDDYVKHAKDVFAALNFSTISLERIGNLKESDFPTKEAQKVKEKINRQKNEYYLFLQSNVIDEISGMKDGMKDGLSEMKDGMSGMKDEMSRMRDGMSELKDGMKDGMSEMKDGMSGIKDGMSELKDGIKDGISEMKDRMSGMNDGMSGMKDEMSEMKDGMSELKDGMKDGMSGIKDRMCEMKDGMGELKDGMKDGMSGIKDKMSGMKDGMSEMKDGMSEMKDGISGMKDGISEMKDGMSEMNKKLNSIEGVLTQTNETTELQDEVRGIKHKISGVEHEMKSINKKLTRTKETTGQCTTTTDSEFKDFNDVLLLTVDDTEFNEAQKILKNVEIPSKKGDRDKNCCFGEIGGNKVTLLKVPHFGKTGASTGHDVLVYETIQELKPKAIVSLGVCDGVRKEEHFLGDVVVSSQVYFLEQQEEGLSTFYRTTYDCNLGLVHLFDRGKFAWVGPCDNVVVPKVHVGQFTTGLQDGDEKEGFARGRNHWNRHGVKK